MITVIVHHSGRRDVYVPRRGSNEVDAVSFTDDQARRLGALLAGVYFKPAAVAQVEAVIGGLLIDWVTLHEGSPGVGRSIADLEIRRRTRMTRRRHRPRRRHAGRPRPLDRARGR